MSKRNRPLEELGHTLRRAGLLKHLNGLKRELSHEWHNPSVEGIYQFTNKLCDAVKSTGRIVEK